jgi:hypothetical protein
MKTLNPQILAAYWGCGIFHHCDNSPFQYRGVEYTSDEGLQPKPKLYGDWSGGTNPEQSCESYTEWDDIKLILKPLSKLSDADALAISMICGLSHGDYVYKLRMGRELVTEYWRRVSNVAASSWVKVFDYLRANGYDCGYADIPSLIDAGLAMEPVSAESEK